MKRLNFLQAFLFISIFGIFDSCNPEPNFYYGKNGKIEIARQESVIGFVYDSPSDLEKLVSTSSFKKIKFLEKEEFNFNNPNVKFIQVEEAYKKTIIQQLNNNKNVKTLEYVFIQDGSDYVSGATHEISVRFKKDVSMNKINDYIQKRNLKIIQQSKSFPRMMKLKGNEEDIFKVANALNKSKLTIYAHPNLYQKTQYNSSTSPQVPAPNRDRHHEILNTYKAWNITRGSSDVVIAVIDNGMDVDHRDFQNKIVGKFNLTSGSRNNVFPTSSTDKTHGTLMAGLAAGNGPIKKGVCPNCKIIAVKSDDRFSFDLAILILDQLRLKSDVFLISWSYTRDISYDLLDAIEEAGKSGRDGKGIITCYAIGNYGGETCSSDRISSVEEVITVGGSGINYELDNQADYGKCLDVVGPSFSIQSTTFDYNSLFPLRSRSKYSNASGTSAANALVSGICGLMISQYPDLKDEEIKHIIELSSVKKHSLTYDKKGHNDLIGQGRVNAHKALTMGAQIHYSEPIIKKDDKFCIMLKAYSLKKLKNISWYSNDLVHDENRKVYNISNSSRIACIDIKGLKFQELGTKKITVVVTDINYYSEEYDFYVNVN